MLHELFFAQLSLLTLLVELGLALALLLALPAEQLLAKDGDAHQGLLERFIIDVLRRACIIDCSGIQGGISPLTWLNIVLIALNASEVCICQLCLLHCVAECALQLLR